MRRDRVKIMKHYQATLKASAIVGTLPSMMKSLSKIKAETEDSVLMGLLDDAIVYLQNAYACSGPSVPSALEKHIDARAKKLLIYCRERVKAVTPEWQVIAHKHGWKPPAK